MKYLKYAVYFVLFALLIGAFIYLGEKDFKDEVKLSDAQKFSLEYESVDKNNMFKYVYGSEAVDIISNKTGIIYLGFSSNDWSKYYIKYLYPILKQNNIKTVYYYDILKDRVKYSKYYRELESLLSDYLYELDNGTVRVSTPALILVKNGKIIYYDDETSIERNNITPDYYWNEERIINFQEKINTYLNEVNFNE